MVRTSNNRHVRSITSNTTKKFPNPDSKFPDGVETVLYISYSYFIQITISLSPCKSLVAISWRLSTSPSAL